MSQTTLSFNELRLPAIRVRQSPGRELFTFAIDGKRLSEVATVSRVHRNDENTVSGYQRPEVQAHIREIRAYLESDAPVLPNALVIAFDVRVQFHAEGASNVDYATPGHLVIPLSSSEAEEDRPGWIVDGQQRAAAIRTSKLERFPVFATAFITDSVEEQRAQFILVNNTKPLPAGLIHELLPGTQGHLPTRLQRKKLPALLVDRLNQDPDSPFCGIIKTPTTPDGRVQANSLLRMLENSLSDGCLYGYRDPVTGEGDVEAMLGVVKTFWQAAKETWPEAWELPPRRSRLLHGAGIAALGYVMDSLDSSSSSALNAGARVAFGRMVKGVAWTTGEWSWPTGESRQWNSIQNTSQDQSALASLLLHLCGSWGHVPSSGV